MEIQQRRQPEALRRAQQRAIKRRRDRIKILAIGIPCLALILFAGWYLATSTPPNGNRSGMFREQAVNGASSLRLSSEAQTITADEFLRLAESVSEDSNGSKTSEANPISFRTSGEHPYQNESPHDPIGDWRLLLANPWNPVPEGYDVTLTQLMNGHAVDARCYPDLQEMIDDCRAAGYAPLICSSYRTYEKQKQLFDNRVISVMAQGLSEADAKVEAAKINAVPGTSEHQLGLAVDIVDVNNQNLDESQEKTATQKWLMQNSWKYGFILRYPADKSDVTGIIYEPWHYRYVGKDTAKEIFETDVCLEEYLEQQP
jgi:D-alanyl-D-alanine carboxypeptidase